MTSGTLEIRTPEGIVFSQTLASPVVRFLAWFMDFLCFLTLMIGVNLLLGLLRIVSEGLAGAALTLSYFVISIGYGILLEWMWRGQTIGKKLFRLRVVDAEGMRLQFDQIVTRNLLRAVDLLPGFYLAGGLTAMLNRKYQRLGDIAANTIVIRIPGVSEPDLDQLLSGKFNSLRLHPHLAARLRQRVSPGEASTALQALIRREEFEPAARVDLFEQLAAHFQAKVQFPDEAIEGIAPEQYMRNVVDVIYRAPHLKKESSPHQRATPSQHPSG